MQADTREESDQSGDVSDTDNDDHSPREEECAMTQIIFIRDITRVTRARDQYLYNVSDK